jgi:hypothetical protein
LWSLDGYIKTKHRPLPTIHTTPLPRLSTTTPTTSQTDLVCSCQQQILAALGVVSVPGTLAQAPAPSQPPLVLLVLAASTSPLPPPPSLLLPVSSFHLLTVVSFYCWLVCLPWALVAIQSALVPGAQLWLLQTLPRPHDD